MTALADELAEVTRGFDPRLVLAQDASRLVEALSRIERIASAGKAQAASRAAEGCDWKRDGFKSPADWLAQVTGTTKGDAHRTLGLGDRLIRHEQTRDQYTAGHLSQQQADVITKAADDDPDSEEELLQTAEDDSLQALKEEAARIRAAAADERERHERLHRERYVSMSSDEDGAHKGSWRMAPDQGGIVSTILQRFCDQIAKEAKHRGEQKTRGQIAADALVRMSQVAAEAYDGHAPGFVGQVLPQVTMHILLSEEARQRGHVEAGETCEIDGVGPIPVATALELASQSAFVTATRTRSVGPPRVAHLGTLDPSTLTHEKLVASLERDGVEVGAIDLPGRAHIPAVLRTAIIIRDRTCQWPGCDQRAALETDHKIAVELDGRTRYVNLQRLCWHHHLIKTRDDMHKIRAQKAREPAPECATRGAPSRTALASTAPARAGPPP